MIWSTPSSRYRHVVSRSAFGAGMASCVPDVVGVGVPDMTVEEREGVELAVDEEVAINASGPRGVFCAAP